MRHIMRKRGFTLVEVTISTLILCVATLAVAGLLVHGLQGWCSGTSKEAATGDATLALQRLSADVRDGASVTFQPASYGSGNMMVVKFPGTMTDGSTTYYDPASPNVHYRYYFVYHGNLIRCVSGQRTIILGRGLKTATFGAGTDATVTNVVSVVLETSNQVGSSKNGTEVSGMIALRNFRN